MRAQEKRDVNSANQSLWRIDESHSTVEFSIKKLLFLTVTGRLAKLEGTILLDEDQIDRSSVEAILEASSIGTGNSNRDSQLRAKSFLNVANHPVIRFESKHVGRGRDRDVITVKGTLTIKGRSNDIVLEVTEVDRSCSPNGGEVIYYGATTEIDRFAFGVNGLRGLVAGKLKVVINIQANRC